VLHGTILSMSKESSVGRSLFFPVIFVKEVVEQLREVSWPSRKETIRSTAIVIGLSLGVGLYIGALDFVFTKGATLLFTLK